jgi:hypothetical protein
MESIYAINFIFVVELLLPTHKGADWKFSFRERVVLRNDNVNSVWFWGKVNAILIWDGGGWYWEG